MTEDEEIEQLTDEVLCERLQDAVLALEEIQQGRAKGFRIPLRGRAVVESCFYYISRLLVLYPPFVSLAVLTGVVVLFSAFATGFVMVEVETNEEKLWVESEGRLNEEIGYTEHYLPKDNVPTTEILIQTVMGRNFTISLMDHLRLLLSVKKIVVERGNKNYTLNDLCLKESFPSTHFPVLDQLLTGLNPCLILTPLDCFWEGSFVHQPVDVINISSCSQYTWSANATWSNVNVSEAMQCARDLYKDDSLRKMLFGSVENGLEQSGVKGYNERPCILGSYNGQSCPSQPAVNVSEVLRGGCSGFASNAMKWPEQILVAGSGWRGHRPGANPEALQTILQLFGPGELGEHLKEDDVDVAHYEAVLTEWKKKFTKFVNEFKGEQGDDFHGWSSYSATSVVKTFSETNPALIVTGYILMLVYCALAFARFDVVQSRAGAGVVGLLLIVMSVVGALGLCLYFGIIFNATSLHVLPFLVLGLGVDDMFVIGDAFFESDDKLRKATIRERITVILRQVGPNITLTSITNACGFFLAAIIPIPAMRNFAIQVGIAVVCNYFVILFGFTSFVVFDTFRLQHNHLDILCCIPAFWRKKVVSKKGKQTVRNPNSFEVVTATALSCEPCDHQPTPSLEPNTNKSDTDGTADSISEGNISHFIKQAGEFLRGHSIVAKLVTRFYSPLLQNHFVKILVVVFFCAIVIPLAIMGCFRVKDGLDLLEVVPEDTEEYGFVNASFSYFTYYDMYVVTKEMNYSGKQVELMMMHDELLPLNHIVKGNGTETSSFWLKAMVSFYQTFYKRICIDKEGGVEAFLNQFLEGLLDRGNCDGPLTDTVYRNINGEKRNFTIIPPKVFYEFLTVWVAIDPVSAGVSVPEFHPPIPTWDPVLEINNFLYGNATIPTNGKDFEYAQMTFYVDGLRETEDYVELITESRAIIERYADQGVPAYPRGVPFIYWEQYFGLRERVIMAIGLILLVSFLATSFFLMDPWSGLLLVVMLIFTAVEVFGFMGWIDIRFSAIPAVTLIVSVGIAVEATAPMSFYFLKACGSQNERMDKALRYRFVPILNGGVSTFLGIIMLAFSPFPFITKYFFVLLLSCIILSLVNGLLLLPVVLSLIGPPSQARIKGHAVYQF